MDEGDGGAQRESRIWNKVLEPLRVMSEVVFFNEVYFDWSTLLPLPVLLGCGTNPRNRIYCTFNQDERQGL